MHQSERQKRIQEILRREGFVPVRYLTEVLEVSTATVNRDLNDMEKQGLVQRSWGGAETVKKQAVPLPFRYDYMKKAKRRVSRAAASFILPGETVFIDGSTTTEYMAEHLTGIDGLRVVTNNNALAAKLSESGVEAVCLGGKVIESPCITGGLLAENAAATVFADKMFFASGGMTADGRVLSTAYMQLHRMMMRNSREHFYLLDHEKLFPMGKPGQFVLCDLSAIEHVVSDMPLPESLRLAYPGTDFVVAEEEEKKR